MEEKIKERISRNIRQTMDALIAATASVLEDSPNGAIGALMDEDSRIRETLGLLQALRDFR